MGSSEAADTAAAPTAEMAAAIAAEEGGVFTYRELLSLVPSNLILSAGDVLRKLQKYAQKAGSTSNPDERPVTELLQHFDRLKQKLVQQQMQRDTDSTYLEGFLNALQAVLTVPAVQARLNSNGLSTDSLSQSLMDMFASARKELRDRAAGAADRSRGQAAAAAAAGTAARDPRSVHASSPAAEPASSAHVVSPKAGGSGRKGRPPKTADPAGSKQLSPPSGRTPGRPTKAAAVAAAATVAAAAGSSPAAAAVAAGYAAATAAAAGSAQPLTVAHLKELLRLDPNISRASDAWGTLNLITAAAGFQKGEQDAQVVSDVLKAQVVQSFLQHQTDRGRAEKTVGEHMKRLWYFTTMPHVQQLIGQEEVQLIQAVLTAAGIEGCGEGLATPEGHQHRGRGRGRGRGSMHGAVPDAEPVQSPSWDQQQEGTQGAGTKRTRARSPEHSNHTPGGSAKAAKSARRSSGHVAASAAAAAGTGPDSAAAAAHRLQRGSGADHAGLVQSEQLQHASAGAPAATAAAAAAAGSGGMTVAGLKSLINIEIRWP